jgi:hypothetical protein
MSYLTEAAENRLSTYSRDFATSCGLEIAESTCKIARKNIFKELNQMKELNRDFYSTKRYSAGQKGRLRKTARIAPGLGVAITALSLFLVFSTADPPRAHGRATFAAAWTVYDYNPSGQELRPRVSPDAMSATTIEDSTSFPFLPNVYTARLTTTDPSLAGDLSRKTLNLTVRVTGGSGTFQDQNNGGCNPDTKTVRFFITSPQASGTTDSDTRGFYTQFWWSSPMSIPLVAAPQAPMAITQPVNAPGMWSDLNGRFNNSSSEAMEDFLIAIQNVKTVGLSFGGGCFFENGVTTSDGSGTFNSTFTETP